MPKIIIIAAIDEARGLGKDGKLLCHLPADLKHFRQLTTGHTVLMGRKTFESLPGGALPNRRNLVLSSKPYISYANCQMVHSLEEAFACCQEDELLFVMGGSSLYGQVIANAEVIELTKIAARFDADVFFPEIDLRQWTQVWEESHPADDRHPFAYTFVRYVKS